MIIKIGPMPPNNFPPLYSIYIRIYGIKALGSSRRRLGTRRREGWALVVGEGWVLFVGEGWALVVGEGWKRCWCYRSRTGTDKPPGFDLPLYCFPQYPRPSHSLGPREAHNYAHWSGRFTKYWTII